MNPNETLMFDPNSRAQQFLRVDDRANIDKLKEKGWLQNPPLLAFFNPHTKKHITDQVSMRRKWENEGYFAEPHYAYHPKETHPRLVSREEFTKLLKNGWYESPAHFPGNDIGNIKTPHLHKEAS